MSTEVRLSAGVATRNRPESLARCLSSLALIGDLLDDIIVVDDSSDRSVAPVVARMPSVIATKLRLIEQAGNRGPIVARNTMLRLAANESVLLLDDDAYLLDGAAVRSAHDVLRCHPRVAAVACAQAERDGSPWPPSMQPSPVTYPCLVPAYIGFAHLVRKNVFTALGGYREAFHFYGEEKDFCLRLLDAGYQVVYLPDARVAHVPDPAGRDDARYLRYVIRNDCLSALYNEPLPLALLTVPFRLQRYASMRKHGGVSDPGGVRWVVGQLAKALPGLVRSRTPVRWSSVQRWRRLQHDWPAFDQHAGGAHVAEGKPDALPTATLRSGNSEPVA